ncbi:hypothetical protein ALI144C_42085 [Actinosynnema sp. ALI-1.44]|uniref:hypothetical protein n=1 Tax=Actinosynnema sp. ALI-1.44 TaxID=1933779 RepID=UPI00097C71D1|nr:hypothetical protein [Actinosynnema sp. ALI-1.44]ONI72617.1 hypothetical protein ALI144C_42085 [Actinosynnema sp. ALI-1.44]
MSQPVEAVLNPLTDVPLLGYVITVVNDAFTQLSLPFWLRSLIELVLAGLLGYALLRLLASRLLPWLGTALVTPAVLVGDLVRTLLLLPDLAVSRGMRRLGRIPPEVVYAYGTVVMTSVDLFEKVVRRLVPKLAAVKNGSGIVLVVLLVVLFLVWNSQSCAGGPPADGACVSPITHWTTSLSTWFTELGATDQR